MFSSRIPKDQRSTDWQGTQSIMEIKHGMSSQPVNSYCTFAFIYSIRVPFQISLSDTFIFYNIYCLVVSNSKNITHQSRKKNMPEMTIILTLNHGLDFQRSEQYQDPWRKSSNPVDHVISSWGTQDSYIKGYVQQLIHESTNQFMFLLFEHSFS